MPLTQNQLEAFHRDGFILLEDLFDSAEMAAALNNMEHIFYGKSYAEYLAELDRTGKANSVEPTVTNAVAHYGDTEYGRAQFPTEFDSLDRLIENEEYLDIFAQCLGTNDVSYCNAHLFMRSGPTDQRHPEHPWQGYHADHGTNSFLPLSHAIGSFDYVNSGVYLHDVDDDCAPMHVIPGSHRQAADALLRLGGNLNDIRDVAEFAEPLPATARAGSALFYSSYLIHAAVPFKNKRKQRAFWTLSMARGDASRWTKLANPWSGPERLFFQPFWEKTTPLVRSLFGWPAPGHAYYTEATLKGIAIQYPNMDLTPYQDGLSK
jgi:ectoine hydroxylase-related dioxygenase (phytanoyl-CoA dioxygenase family)